MRTTRQAKLGIPAAFFITGLLLTVADASILENARTGEHGLFTRLVFQFQEGAPENIPLESVGEGRLSVRLPNTRTDLPTPVKFERRKRVERIEFFQKESDLVATIILRLPYFSLKSFHLRNPARVVFDLYWIAHTPQGLYPRKAHQGDAGEDVPLAKAVSAGPEKHIALFSRDIPTNRNVRTRQEVANSTQEDVRDSIEDVLIPYMQYGFWQTFLLAALNFLTIIVVMMLAFMLSRQVKRVDVPDRVEDPKGPHMKDENRKLMLIDAGIQKRLRKYSRNKAA